MTRTQDTVQRPDFLSAHQLVLSLPDPGSVIPVRLAHAQGPMTPKVYRATVPVVFKTVFRIILDRGD